MSLCEKSSLRASPSLASSTRKASPRPQAYSSHFSGALGSGLAIFTRFPLISAQALPYSLSGSPAQAFAGDFFVKKAAANVVILHPLLGEVEIWTNHVGLATEWLPHADSRCMPLESIPQIQDRRTE
jgi:hypothetical protein